MAFVSLWGRWEHLAVFAVLPYGGGFDCQGCSLLPAVPFPALGLPSKDVVVAVTIQWPCKVLVLRLFLSWT